MEHYVVLASYDKIAYFVAEVNKKIRQGWKPVGGVSVDIESYDKKIVMQSMIKDRK